MHICKYSALFSKPAGLRPAALFLSVTIFSTTAFAQFPGDKLWEFETGGEIYSSPALGDDGTIYFGSRDRKLYALSPAGRKKWEFLTGGAVDASPAIGPDGTIYIGSNDNTLYAISPEGVKLWEFPTRGPISQSAAIGGDGTIYVMSQDWNLYAVNPNGSKKWQFNTGAAQPAPTVGSDGSIYIATRDPADNRTGFLYALKPDGTVNWRFRLATSRVVTSSCIINEQGHILFKEAIASGFSIAHLMVLRPTGEKHADLFLTDSIARGAPILGQGGIIYDESHGTTITSFNPNGSVRWRTADLSMNPQPVLSSDGLVIGGSATGRLHAFDIANGTQKWAFSGGGRFEASPVIATNGTIYAGSTDRKLYAVAGTAGPASGPWPMYRRDTKRTGAVNNTTLDHVSLGVNMYAGLAINGTVGARYRIEYSDKVPAVWEPLSTVTLDRTLYRFFDLESTNASKRFYRAVLLQ